MGAGIGSICSSLAGVGGGIYTEVSLDSLTLFYSFSNPSLLGSFFSDTLFSSLLSSSGQNSSPESCPLQTGTMSGVVIL